MYFIDKKRIFWKKVDRDVVILDIETGVYYDLNEAGARIWELALNLNSLEEIVEELLNTFDGERDVVYRDTKKILQDFLDENILLEKKG